MNRFNLPNSSIDRVLSAAKYIQASPIERQLAQITRHENLIRTAFNRSLVGFDQSSLFLNEIGKMQCLIDKAASQFYTPHLNDILEITDNYRVG